MAVYTLTAVNTPAVQVPATYLDPTLGAPTTSPAFPALTAASAIGAKLRTLSAGVDALGRAGGGGYGVAFGLELTVDSGLTLAISAGQAVLDGTVTKAASTLALTNNIARIYLWMGQNGTVTAVHNSLTPPAGAQVFLGSAVTSGGAITEIDYSGRIQVLRGGLWTRYADAATPGNTPPATVTFDALTTGGLYHWDGAAWTAYGGTVSTALADTSDVAKGDALVGYKSTLTGAVGRTLHARMEELVINAGDWNPPKDGVSNASTALQAAINAAMTIPGASLFIPRGTYRCNTGLVVTDTDGLHIFGEGRATVLTPGANSTVVLTLLSSDTASPDTSYGSVSKLRIRNPNSFTGCTGILLDRARRNRLEQVTTEQVTTGIELKTSWIVDIVNCFVRSCTTGIETQNYHTSGTTQGPSHALWISGGEIEGNSVGVRLRKMAMAGVYNTTIEGNSLYGVEIIEAENITLDPSYWECPPSPSPSAYDVNITGGATISANIRIHNASRINGTACLGLTTFGFIDRAATVALEASRLNVTDSVREIVMIGTKWDTASAGNTDSRADILTAYNKGFLRIVGGTEHEANVVPQDDWGPNLLENGEMFEARGWTLSNMSAETTVVPFGATASIKTTSTGAVCTAQIAVSPTWDNMLRGQSVTLSVWVRIPNTTWAVAVGVVDGNRDKEIPVPNTHKDDVWRRVTTTIRLGDTATGLQFIARFTPTAGSGVCYIAGATITLGKVATRPLIPEHLLPARQTLRRRAARTAVVALTNTGQIDAKLGGVILVEGSGGPVTMTTTQALFSGSYQDGHTVTLEGNSDTNTLTLTAGGSAGVRLGAANRLLRRGDTITFRYSAAIPQWNAEALGRVAESGDNSDITSVRGLVDGSAGGPSIRFASDPNTGLYRIGAEILGIATNGAEQMRVGTAGATIVADIDAAGGFRQTVDGWWADNLSGTAGPTQMTRFGAGAAFPNVWIAPRAGSITAVVVKSSEARTAGTATVEVFLNGVATGLTAVLDGTNTTVKATTQAKDTDAFVAGDELDLRVTTAGWTPTTADIRAALEVET